MIIQNMEGDLQRKFISKRFADLSTKAKSQKRYENATCGSKNHWQSNL